MNNSNRKLSKIMKKLSYLNKAAAQSGATGGQNMIEGLNAIFFVLDVKPFNTKTVSELVEGYTDPLLKMANFFGGKGDTFSLLKVVIFFFYF